MHPVYATRTPSAGRGARQAQRVGLPVPAPAGRRPARPPARPCTRFTRARTPARTAGARRLTRVRPAPAGRPAGAAAGGLGAPALSVDRGDGRHDGHAQDKAPLVGSIRSVGARSTQRAGRIGHIVIEPPGGPGALPYVEGQSVGVQPPGLNAKGKPHSTRLYSIASTRYGDDGKGDTVSLCVRRAVYWDAELGREDPAKKGVCSNWLCDAAPGTPVKLTGPTGKILLLPDDPAADVIMVATGTGIAPFRGFLRRLFFEPTTTRAREFSGLAWLFLGVPVTESLIYADDWDAVEAAHGAAGGRTGADEHSQDVRDLARAAERGGRGCTSSTGSGTPTRSSRGSRTRTRRLRPQRHDAESPRRSRRSPRARGSTGTDTRASEEEAVARRGVLSGPRRDQTPRDAERGIAKMISASENRARARRRRARRRRGRWCGI